MPEIQHQPLITVITVSYNAAKTIEQTMLSVLNQTYPNIEYIIIDGGSTDGTVDIIKKYADRLAYWVSEPDKGIYDAMNKGIKVATGEWINFMNCGDCFCDETVLNNLFCDEKYPEMDVIYGNSVEIDKQGNRIKKYSDSNVNKLQESPIYRHGASFVKSFVQKQNLFDLSMSKKIGFALDYLSIYKIYKAGYTFCKSDVFIMDYIRDGVSNDPLKSIVYNYRITKIDNAFSIKRYLKLIFNIIKLTGKKNLVVRYLFAVIHHFFVFLVSNKIITNIPIWIVRKSFYKIIGMSIGKGSEINMNLYLVGAKNVEIGSYTHINKGCLIDGRGGCVIGNNVSISYNVSIVTGGHQVNSSSFVEEHAPIFIDDFVWIGVNSIILKGVSIGKGAVVAAGSVVTKDVEAFSVVAGTPAKKISNRNPILNYKCKCGFYFT